jgi:hypothetical protein
MCRPYRGCPSERNAEGERYCTAWVPVLPNSASCQLGCAGFGGSHGPPRRKRRRRSQTYAVTQTSSRGNLTEAGRAGAEVRAPRSHGWVVVVCCVLPFPPSSLLYCASTYPTADVQLHAWGHSLTEAFEQAVLCMFAYVSELRFVEVDASETKTVSVQGTEIFQM